MDQDTIEYLKSLGISVARGVPQLATGFVDLAALPFTATGLIKPEQAIGSTDWMTAKGYLPPKQEGLLSETTELLSGAINPAGAVKGGLLGAGALLGTKNIKTTKQFYENPIEKISSEIKFLKNEPISSIMDQWIGGVSGLGNRAAGYDLPYVPKGVEYQKATQESVKKSLGEKFTGYRLMHEDELDELLSGSMGSELASFTLDKDIAKSFSNLAAFRKADKNKFVIVEMDLTPEHVWMAGKPSEKELVINYGIGYNPEDLKITRLLK